MSKLINKHLKHSSLFDHTSDVNLGSIRLEINRLSSQLCADALEDIVKRTKRLSENERDHLQEVWYLITNSLHDFTHRLQSILPYLNGPWVRGSASHLVYHLDSLKELTLGFLKETWDQEDDYLDVYFGLSDEEIKLDMVESGVLNQLADLYTLSTCLIMHCAYLEALAYKKQFKGLTEYRALLSQLVKTLMAFSLYCLLYVDRLEEDYDGEITLAEAIRLRIDAITPRVKTMVGNLSNHEQLGLMPKTMMDYCRTLFDHLLGNVNGNYQAVDHTVLPWMKETFEGIPMESLRPYFKPMDPCLRGLDLNEGDL